MMETRVRAERTVLVGALVNSRTRAPFVPGPVLLRLPEGSLLQASRYEGGDAVGTLMAEEDLRGLVLAGEATDLAASSIRGEVGLYAWAVQDSYPGIDDLLHDLTAAEALVSRVRDGSGSVLVVRRAAAASARAEAARRATALAQTAAHRGDWAAARGAASAAWGTAQPSTPATVALYAWTMTQAGAASSAAALRKGERRANGDDFDREVERELGRLGVRLTAGLPQAVQPGSASTHGRRRHFVRGVFENLIHREAA